MEGRGNDVLITAILFFVLTWLTVGLRVYVRGFLLNIWGKDDSAMLLTLVIFTVYLAFQIAGAVYGTGQHRQDLSYHDNRIALLFVYLCELTYVLANCTLKIALGIFYLRVAIKRWHVLCIKTLMIGTVLFGSVYLIIAVFQCIPVSEFWNNHPASDRCIPIKPTLAVTYALGIANAAADWAFGILPIFIVRSLQMKLRMKILTAGILAFAAIGSTATLVRLKFMHALTDGEDFLYATTDIAILSTVEPGIGIAAGSMATLRPLLKYILWLLGKSPNPPSRIRGSGRSGESSDCDHESQQDRHDIEVSEFVLDEENCSTATIATTTPLRKNTWPPSNWPPIAHKRSETMDSGTQLSVMIEQEVEGPPRLLLRDSLRHSFAHGTMLSKNVRRSFYGNNEDWRRSESTQDS